MKKTIHIISSNVVTATISDLKRDPIGVVNSGKGAPVLVFNHSRPAFYCLTLDSYENLIERIEDIEDAALVRTRLKDKQVRVPLSEL